MSKPMTVTCFPCTIHPHLSRGLS